MTAYTVVDVGGTTLRVGRYDSDTDRVDDVRRMPTEGMDRYPGEPVPVLQRRVVGQLVDVAGAALARHGARRLVVAFAGPIDAAGRVTAAPTVWGRRGDPLPLRDLLRERLGRPVTVVNDLTAAAWRYVGGADQEAFCLITVSSGIGNKVFRAGEVLLHPDGHGGELGHWTCDPAPDAMPCDCGGRGHLGAVASGRGAVAAARRAAVADPVGYGGSVLAGAEVDAVALAAAVRADDPFATGVLRAGLRHLATAITAVFASIGVRRYVIIGGFALAVGPRYAALLTEALHRAGCFGLTPAEIDGMVVLGEPDDDHGLIGAGRLLTHTLPTPRPPAALLPRDLALVVTQNGTEGGDNRKIAGERAAGESGAADESGDGPGGVVCGF
ncbi:ROK family protein [Polymorphospora sp. NPDC051019]|uniref:ROK family protein n=1 Tax=Polymorphospora sp. NPDC051019 TaxID=3155725 RepID=UPI0034240042